MNTGHLTENLLGTGQLDPCHEQRMLADGVQFAGIFTAPDGESFVASCAYPNIYDRFAEQVTRLYYEERGLPARYRIPTPPATPVTA